MLKVITTKKKYTPKSNPIIEWKEKSEGEVKNNQDWKRRLHQSVRVFSATNLLQLSGIPVSELFSISASKPIDDESTMQRVSCEVKRTLAHYRMAIIILLFSTVLMATPVKWEDTRSWKRLFSKFVPARFSRTLRLTVR